MGFAYLRKVIIRFVVAVRPHRATRHSLDGFSNINDMWEHLQITCKKILSCLDLKRIMVTVHQDKYTFMTSRRILLRKTNILEVIFRKSKVSFYVQYLLFWKLFRLWDMRINNRGTHGTSGNIVGRKRLTCWLDKSRDSPSEYLKLLLFHVNYSYTAAPQYYGYT